MAETPKIYTQIDIKPPPQPTFSLDFSENQKITFFNSGSRRRGDTWVISVFVILHVLAFIATMLVNDCWTNSHQDCALKELGRFSFQPLSENPLLGPSASTLDVMGALRLKFLTEYHQNWRLLASACLHAGAIHLIFNLSSVIFIGIHLEQEFGPLRIGTIYVLSAFVGSLTAAIFAQNSPVVASSGALFGLLGAMLSGLIRNWKLYAKKFAALLLLVLVAMINFSIGLLPYVGNYSNIGGFISGFLLGFVLLFSPDIRQVMQNKGGLSDYGAKSSLKLKQKLDRPVLRSVSLLLFCIVFSGCVVAFLQGININQHCSWCRYIDCVPYKRWSCNDITTSCETRVGNEQLTLTCTNNGKFKVFPFTNISLARIQDLCSLICS